MSEAKSYQEQVEKLQDFAELTRRILELYEEVRVTTTRELLLHELRQRLNHLNGSGEFKPFKAYLTVLAKLFTELPAHPEHAEAGIICAEQLAVAIDNVQYIRIHSIDFSPKANQA